MKRNGRSPESGTRAVAAVPFREALRFWVKLGFVNFGGPAGQIAIMHEELVERRRWIGEKRFLHALNFCMLLPGPEAQQLAIYVGWLLNGTSGGLVAGIFFVVPAFFFILGLSWTYAVHGDIQWVAAIFYGLAAAVIGIVAAAVIRVGTKALENAWLGAIAVSAFVAVFFVKVPFPLVVVGAALAGVFGARLRPDRFVAAGGHGETDDDAAVGDREAIARERPSAARLARVLLVGLAVWWLPLLAVVGVRGLDDTLSQEAFFFSQAAMVTFGGAYAVLAYINQAAVQHFGWLEPGQMVTGLGLAESTPGPLIMVTEFVGFLAAYRFPGGLHPVVAGILGALVTTWATFAPCFLWVFLGAPYIETLRGRRSLAAALSGVTAAVVGVILNLAVVFAVHTLFTEVDRGALGPFTFPLPLFDSVEFVALAIAGVSFVGLWRYRWKVVPVVLAAAAVGLVYEGLT